MDRVLSGATILGQSGPGSNGNDELLPELMVRKRI